MAPTPSDPEHAVVLPDIPPYSEAAVCTWFGVTAKAAQTFESALATLTVIVRLAETPGVIPSDLGGNPFESLERSTLGQVLARAKQVVSFYPDLDGWLKDAVATRNRLFHQFFPTNQGRMESEDGRAELVDELRKDMQRFLDLARALDELTDPTIRILGTSAEEVDAEVQRWRDVGLDT